MVEKRELLDKEKGFNEKRIKEATEKVERCNYEIQSAQLNLDLGLEVKKRAAERECRRIIKDATTELNSEKQIIEILQDQIDNGVEIKEETKEEVKDE